MPPQPQSFTDSETPRKRRDLFAWTVLACVALTIALAGPYCLGLTYLADDIGAFHLPLRTFYADQLNRGEPFDWMPQLFSGFYLVGEGQVGAYHPLHLALYRFLPLSAAFACELLGSYPFLLIGTYFFLQRRLKRRDAALFGSLVFTFSSFNLLHFVHPNAIAVVAHVPWLLWAIDVLLSDSNPRRALAAQLGIALLTGSQLLLGYPQYVWFSLLAEAAYAVYLISERFKTTLWPVSRSSHKGRPKVSLVFWRPAVVVAAGPETRAERSAHETLARTRAGYLAIQRLMVAKIAGVMLGGLQLLPTADALRHSMRLSVDTAFVNSGSIHPLNVIQLVAPYLLANRVVGGNTHALGLYLGAVPVVLIVWLFTRRRKLGPLRKPVLTAAGLGLLALVMALGKYGPIYRLQSYLPIVGGFRMPCRYTVLSYLCVAVLSSIAFMLLVRQQAGGKSVSWRQFRPLWTIVAISMAATFVGLMPAMRPNLAGAANILIGPALIGAAAVLVALAARGARWALVALILLAAADLGYYGMSYAVYPQTAKWEQYLEAVDTPPANQDFRVLMDLTGQGQASLQSGNQIVLAGWRRADGYAGLEPAQRLDYRRLSNLRAAGIGWVKRTEMTAAIDGLQQIDEHWLKVPDPLPRIRMATRARQSSDPAADLDRIELESTVLIEQPLGPSHSNRVLRQSLKLPGGTPGVARVVQQRPGRMHVRVESSTAQLLVISESYHSGWKALVDGRNEPVLRANGDFMGCSLGPGEHDVILEFRPACFRNGLIVSCLGLALLLATCLIQLRRPGGKAMARRPSRRIGNQGSAVSGSQSPEVETVEAVTELVTSGTDR